MKQKVEIPHSIRKSIQGALQTDIENLEISELLELMNINSYYRII